VHAMPAPPQLVLDRTAQHSVFTDEPYVAGFHGPRISHQQLVEGQERVGIA
jgi:hypothetical protein